MLIRRVFSLILVALIHVAVHVSAQQQQPSPTIALNTFSTLTVSSASFGTATAFTVEKANEQTTYYVSLSLCTDTTPYPQFYISDGRVSNVTLNLDAGLATWNGTSASGLLIYAQSAGPMATPTEWTFQLAVSTTGE
jgi:hypothetical protein